MSIHRKRFSTGTNELPYKVRCTESTVTLGETHAIEELTKAVQQLTQLVGTVRSLEQTVRQQRYAIENLQREISDLQTHALHGAFAKQVTESGY